MECLSWDLLNKLSHCIEYITEFLLDPIVLSKPQSLSLHRERVYKQNFGLIDVPD